MSRPRPTRRRYGGRLPRLTHRQHGELRLPNPRRSRRRTSWLEQDLRTRRRHLLRTNGRDLGTVAGLYVLTGVALLYATSSHPLLQAGTLGALLAAAAVATIGFLALADGSLLARLGRSIESDVGDELRRTRGVYGVISAVPFDRFDVDHVVLTRNGCFAVEVKALFGRQLSLEETYGLHEKIRQTRRSAKTVAALLRSHGLDLPVHPVLVLAGPGAPSLRGTTVLRDGVRVAAFRDSATWRPAMTGTGTRPRRRFSTVARTETPSVEFALPLATAAAAAEHLLAFCERREVHQQAALMQQRLRPGL